ncbi:monocarboxylate transporter 9 [Halyomorpha halys]|uniref:monocarboxylate transporter 9 n=1 Tax=Halyomorpha halys TaxID=286706 RepID=UPI0006D4E297|nr:monocarboxylate transporter 5 [Halyomorpha halys]
MPQETHGQLVTVPPDGGWGWVIIMVSFVGFIIMDMPCMGFQVIEPFLLEALQVSNPSATLIFSTYVLLMQILGPISGGICNRFGFRITFIIGTLLMATGLFLVFWINNYFLTVLLYGALAGSGSSCILLVCAVAPGFWFERKRPIALGLASSATGFSLVSVHISQLCSEKFGWRYCFIFWTIIICLTGCLSVLLYPPPMIQLQGSVVIDNLPLRTVTALDVVNTNQINRIEKVESVHEIPHEILRSISKQTGIPLASTSRRVPTNDIEQARPSLSWYSISTAGSRPLYKKDVFYNGNLDQALVMSNTPSASYTLQNSKLPTVQDVKEEKEGQWKIPEAVSRAISEMIDLTLLKSTVFLLLLLATFLCYTAVYIPIVAFQKMNKGKIEEKYRFMIPILMGAGITTSRLLIGFLLYSFPSISALWIIVTAAIANGLMLCCVMMSNASAYQLGLAFFSGAFSSIINPLRSVVIIEKLGLDRLTSSIGMLFLVQGISCFIGLPIAELLIQGTGMIYAGLVFSGICFILSGTTYALVGIISILKT